MLVGRIISHFAATRRQRRTTISLAALSERQLDDLGISRLDLCERRRR
jgi:uncharacterized protein YjiS (DUF1127 family)